MMLFMHSIIYDPLNNLFIGTRSGNLYLVDTNGGLALRNIAFHQKPIFDLIAINTTKMSCISFQETAHFCLEFG
ncbi:MAG: hypothetical protein IPJ22_01715 [Bacteroidetes bacterium]|nr:hypothetical protein [Bacteroidota bacterium]